MFSRIRIRDRAIILFCLIQRSAGDSNDPLASINTRCDNTTSIAWLLVPVTRVKDGASGLTLGKVRTGSATKADFERLRAFAHC